MYLRDLWKSCLRRWYFALFCLVVTAGVMFLAAQTVKPKYEAKAGVVLIPPQSREDPGLNRYMALGGLEQSADVLARSLSSDETSRDIVDKAPNAKYEVARDLSTSAPIINVTASSAVRGDAERMLQVVLTEISANLARLQTSLDIKTSDQIIVQRLSRDREPKAVQKTRMRVLGALGAGLLFGSAVAVATLDGLLLQRAARRSRKKAAAQEAAAGNEPVAGPPRREPVGSAPRGPTPGGPRPPQAANGAPRPHGVEAPPRGRTSRRERSGSRPSGSA